MVVCILVQVFVLLQKDYNLKAVRDEICRRFSSLVETSQMIVREDLFLDALDMSGETLQLLRDVILDHGQSYPNFGEVLPTNWLELQGKLDLMRKKGKRIIQYSELEDANATLKEPLSKDQLELFVSFQHNSGLLLHFNEPHLMHIVVLDPKLIIDATKSIITCPRFALDIWGKKEWQEMVATGRVEENYIKRVWRKRDKRVLFKHWEYLLLVMKKLDIITRPKIYLEGSDVNVPVSFYYVPCMLQRQPEARKDNEGDITMSFRFREIDILPPAIYNRYVASCLALWQVEDGRLYDGMVALRSGPLHVVVIRREHGSITVSVRHKKDTSRVDLNLMRSLRQFTGQTLQRVISLYNTEQGDDESFFKIGYNDNAISRGLGPDDEKARTSI